MNSNINTFQAARRLLGMLLMAFVISLASYAQSVNVIVNNQVIQGQKFRVTFRVTNGEAQMSRDNAPKLAGCTFIYGPATSTMYSMQNYNGQQTSSVSTDFSFTYQADKDGKVTIPPTSINVSGKTLTTQAKTFTILPPNQSSQRQQQQQRGYDPFEDFFDEPSAPAQRPQQQQSKSKISANDLIITVNLSKTNLYEKEAVIATIKLYTKHNITKFQPTVMPQFEGFLSEELPLNQTRAEIEHFRGENYYTFVLKKCLLYPQKSGQLKINSGRYDVTLETVEYVSNGFFATPVSHEQNLTTTSNSLTVNVKPLPAGAPAGFNGAVGTFKATAQLNPEQLRTNEAATYTLTISGTGNLKHLAEPKIPFPADVEQYTPQGSANASFNGSNMTGSYTATYTIVPQQVGKLEIPAWQFAYFNPASGKYETIELPSFSRDVTKGAATAAASIGGNIDTSKIKDILHISKVKETDFSTEHNYVYRSAYYWLLMFVMVATLIAIALIYRRHIKAAADVQGLRTRKAKSVATKRLAKARKEMNSHNKDGFYDALSAALWGYLSDRLRIPASELTRENVAEALQKFGASDQQITTTIELLDSCEMARFTPDAPDSELTETYNTAAELIDSLQRIKQVKNKVASTATNRYGE